MYFQPQHKEHLMIIDNFTLAGFATTALALFFLFINGFVPRDDPPQRIRVRDDKRFTKR